MEIYQKNINTLSNARNFLYKTICNSIVGEENDLVVESKIARDGNMYMNINCSEGVFRLNSSYRPLDEAKKWASNYFESNEYQKIITMYGFGNGYCVREISKHLRERDILIVYEPFMEIFLNTLTNYDVTDIIENNKIYLCVGKKHIDEFSVFFSKVVGTSNINYLHEAVHPQYDRFLTQNYREYTDFIDMHKSKIFSANMTWKSIGRVSVINSVYAIKHMERASILNDMLETMPENDTAVIVAAGPSLMKNIEKLTKAKEKAFIVATDTALKTMLKYDIIPDVMVSVDPCKDMINFEDARCNDIPLLCSFDSNKKLLKRHTGKKIYFDNPDYINWILDELGKKNIKLEKGGSVATAAFMMCIALNFKNIILIGQDLAYGKNNESHAEGIIQKNENDKKQLYVEDIYGDNVLSRADWISYLRFFEYIIDKYKDLNVIDATEGGAKIHGTLIMTLEDAIKKYCNKKVDYGDAIKAIPSAFNENEIKKLNDVLFKMVGELEYIKKSLVRLIKCSYELIEYIKCGNNNLEVNAWNNFGEMYKKVNEYKVMQILYCFSMDECGEYYETLNEGYDNEIETSIHHFEKYAHIFEILVKNIPKLISVIKED